MVRPYPLLALQLFASSVVAQQRLAPRAAEPTPFIPGQVFAKRVEAPQPTSPPQVLRKALLARDAATCGWMMADGSPNVCGENQYCFTSASGEFGVWNCCNPGSCYTATGCTKDKECGGDTNYCVTSFMSNSGTTFSRFMCGTTSSIVSMAYRREDTPQYTASQLSVSEASALAASALSASIASASRAAQQSSTTASVPPSSTVSSSAAEVTSDTATTSTKKSGLSTGALVGIIIAVVVIIALLGAIAFFIWRKRNNAAASHPPPTAAEMSGAPLMSGGPTEHYKPHAYPDTYAHHGQVGPAGVQQYPAELDGPPSYAQPVVHEMPSNAPAK